METLLIKKGPEASEARREFIDRLRAAVGRSAVGSLVSAPRPKSFGEQLTATDDLRKHRKEIQQKRNAGLEEALSQRRAYAEKTKADLKFAKHGYSRSDKKVALRVETNRLKQQLTSEREASGRIKQVEEREGVVGKLGNVLVRRSNKRELKRIRGDAKEFAKLSIRQREEAEHKQLRDYELAHQEAKSRRFQTAHALVRSKLHLTGRRSNAIASLRGVRRSGQDPAKVTEERLQSLAERRAENESKLEDPRYHTISTSQKPYIAAANAGMGPEAHQRRADFYANENNSRGPETPLTTEEIEAIGPIYGPELPSASFAPPVAGTTADPSIPATAKVAP